jgi:hypothetical protein
VVSSNRAHSSTRQARMGGHPPNPSKLPGCCNTIRCANLRFFFAVIGLSVLQRLCLEICERELHPDNRSWAVLVKSRVLESSSVGQNPCVGFLVGLHPNFRTCPTNFGSVFLQLSQGERASNTNQFTSANDEAAAASDKRDLFSNTCFAASNLPSLLS